MIQAADLFCGAGGTSTGLAQACKSLRKPVSLVAVNHWATAVETHRRNHPWAEHHCLDLGSQDAHPTRLVPGGRLDILAGSAECTQHSQARGSSVCTNPQSRASGWHIIHWLEQLKVQDGLVENVKEWRRWGPTDRRGKPIKSREGELYHAWLRALDALGFYHEEQVLCCANYGDATTRERLFVQFRRGKRPTWPRLSHRNRWRPAAEIIDWNLRGKSIFNRKKPLAPNTIERIKAGLKKFGGQAFLVLFEGTSERQLEATAVSVDQPLPTIFGNGSHHGLCEPFILPQFSSGKPRSVKQPLSTLTTTSRGVAFVMPVTHHDKSQRARDVSQPLPAITGAHRGELALVEPFLVKYHGGKPRVHSVGEPLRTADTQNRFALVEPFILPPEGMFRGNAPRSLKRPLQTITSRGGGALVQPFVIGQQSGATPRPVSRPLPTVSTAGAISLVQPFFVKYYGTAGAVPLSEPLPTVTTKDRLGLVEPTRGMDILFRMLKPHELAAATGLDDYELCGNQEDQVKQIGNAVPVKTARAIFREMLR